MQLITINEASTQAGKSIQTIRRMIKQKKVQVKRQKTPQGFNYLIIKESLDDFINKSSQTPIHDSSDIHEDSREHRPITDGTEERFKAEAERFNTTIQKLIEQNERDKANFFELIKTFQDRVFSLETHIKALEAPKSRWYKFWK